MFYSSHAYFIHAFFTKQKVANFLFLASSYGLIIFHSYFSSKNGIYDGVRRVSGLRSETAVSVDHAYLCTYTTEK